MAVIDHIDGPNRDIYLSADTVTSDFEPMDAYKEMRALRRTDENLRKYDVFLQAKGYEPTGPGRFTARYVVQLDGTRFIPYDTSHELTVVGTLITDDGQSGVNCFDRGPLSPSVVVDINYIPPQVEIIELGTSGLTQEESDALLSNAIGITDIESDIAQINATLLTMDDAIAYMTAIEAGEWKIENDQMIFYNEVGVEIARFDLFNALGQPAMDNVFRRVPV